MDMKAPAGAFGGRGPLGGFPPFERNGGMDRGPPVMDMGRPMMMDMGMHTWLTHTQIGESNSILTCTADAYGLYRTLNASVLHITIT